MHENPLPPAHLQRQGSGKRHLVLAIVIYLLTTLVYVATTSPQRLTAHTPYNHFALLAEAWLKGQLDLGGPPPAYTGNNDFALYDRKVYVSFPPFPALLIAPAVKLAGSAEKVRDAPFFLAFAGLGPSFLFLALQKLSSTGRSHRTQTQNTLLALLFAFGSVYWFTAVQGTVWFAAHVIGVACLSIYLYCALDAQHPFLAGLALAFGFATRTPLLFAFPLFLAEAFRLSRNEASTRALTRRLALFALPMALVLALVLWHNQVRFGDPLEFGHRHLAIAWHGRIQKWGLFSYHYLPRNLAVVLTGLPFTATSTAPFQINAHGLALWFTTPIYVWTLWPRRPKPLFWVLAATTLAVAIPSLLYQNTGWIQFGYRFSNDFAPFLFVMMALGKRRFGLPFYTLGLVAVIINAFGAVTFQRDGYEKYYFIDGSQKILHQPD